VPLLNRIRSAALSPSLQIAIVFAIVTFVAAYDNGSYSLPSRNVLAIAFWWTVIVGVALRALNLEGVTRASVVMGGIIAALCTWTFISVFWAPSAENAFTEFNRVSLFLGVFVLTTLAARHLPVSYWCNGLAIAISSVTVVALISRFFPGTFSDQGLNTSLPSAVGRLSFPLGYWNGLAIFAALALPLLLRVAVSSDKAVIRGLAVAPIPAIASTVFLASSRGGVATAFVGIVAFLLLTSRRWTASAALLWGLVGSTASILVLDSRNELVNGPFGTSLVEHQGRTAALFVTLFCVLAGIAYSLSREIASRFAQKRIFRPRPWLGPAVVALVVGVFAIGIVASHPIRQFDTFKRAPRVISTNNFTRQHLTSGSGSGRWQFWTASIDQWKSHPLLGNGAGSYEAWWTKHMPADYPHPVKDAHSLYLQSLGELGIPGFALVLSLALLGIGIGARRALRRPGEKRMNLAALTAVFAAFSAAAAVDWMWELTVVAGVGIVALALLSSAAVTDPGRPRLAENNEPRYHRQRGFGFGVAALVGVWLLICAQGVPLLAQLRIKDSKAYTDSGNTNAAIRAAMDARNLQPWAASPYLQLALVSEKEGQFEQAHSWINSAIKRDPTDWHLWLVASRVDIKLGDSQGAQKSLKQAKSLNPRSPIFAG
jgi:hypothetical protein